MGLNKSSKKHDFSLLQVIYCKGVHATEVIICIKIKLTGACEHMQQSNKQVTRCVATVYK